MVSVMWYMASLVTLYNVCVHSTQRYDVMAYYIPTRAVTVIERVERERRARPKNSRVHKSCTRYAPALAIMNKRTILEKARARRVHKSRIGPSRRWGGLADGSPHDPPRRQKRG